MQVETDLLIEKTEEAIKGIDGRRFDSEKHLVQEIVLEDGRKAQIQVIVTTDDYDFL